MPKYVVCRTFCERWRWTVEAESEEAALAMLDDNEQTPDEAADVEWLGPLHSQADDQDDNAVLVDEPKLKRKRKRR